MEKQLNLDAMTQPKEETKYCVDCKYNTTPAVCYVCLGDGRTNRTKPRWEIKDEKDRPKKS